MGRKYGRLAYGKYSYDLWPTWYPIPPDSLPGEIWVPLPGFPPEDAWVSVSAPPSIPDIWNPVSEPVVVWSSVNLAPAEIWIPVTVSRLE